jgi:hypothetical protein
LTGAAFGADLAVSCAAFSGLTGSTLAMGAGFVCAPFFDGGFAAVLGAGTDFCGAFGRGAFLTAGLLTFLTTFPAILRDGLLFAFGAVFFLGFATTFFFGPFAGVTFFLGAALRAGAEVFFPAFAVGLFRPLDVPLRRFSSWP